MVRPQLGEVWRTTEESDEECRWCDFLVISTRKPYIAIPVNCECQSLNGHDWASVLDGDGWWAYPDVWEVRYRR